MKYTYDKVDDYVKAMTKLNQEVISLGEEETKTYTELEECARELEQKLKNIKIPYEEKIEKLREKQSKLNEQKQKLLFEKDRFICHLQTQSALESGEFDEGSAKAFLTEKRVLGKGSMRPHSTFTLKKEITSIGVKVFREVDEYGNEYTKLFAFKGLELVGLWRKRKGEHRGDDTTGEAFVGDKQLSRENKLSLKLNKKFYGDAKIYFGGLSDDDKAKHPFYRSPNNNKWNIRIDATMKHFLDYLEAHPEELVAIDIEHDKTLEILKEVPY